MRPPVDIAPEDEGRQRSNTSGSEGHDVWPGMDRDIGPTDPAVYQSTRRPPSPYPPVYDLPRPVTVPLGNTTTTMTSNLIRDILDAEFEEEDPVGDTRPRLDSPPYANATADAATSPPPGNEYVEMASNAATRMSGSDAPHSIGSTRAAEAQFSREPVSGYDNLAEPRQRNHPLGERVIPIPQGSPPIERPRQVPIPVYFRDYFHPDVLPAYTFICHSTWYAQASADVIMCSECVTEEHSFCAYNRAATVWRHLHIISRTFEHTQMHCGRCYKLLMKTQRAIDCYQCRLAVIEHRGRIERLTYKVLCETAVPRGVI